MRTLLLAVVLVVSGCEAPAVSKRPSVGLTGMQFSPSPPGPPAPDALANIAATLTTVSDALAAPGDWRETHARMQAAIAAAPDATRALVEQTAAVQMLTRVLARGRAGEQASAAAVYVGMLARHGSPEMVVVADAVDRFAWVWGPEQTAALAARAVTGGEAYLARQRAAGPLGFFDTDVAAAVERLRARAQAE